MIGSLFANKYRRQYAMEIRGLVDKYGDDALGVVRLRSRDMSLNTRDRKHWERIRVAMSPRLFASAQSTTVQAAE